MLDFLGNLQRTHMCGDLRRSNSGEMVTLMGWVHRRRDLGSLIFIHLRDRSGISQIVFNREKNPEAHAKAELLRNEFVMAVTGVVAGRDAETINPTIPTGEVEVAADVLLILNDCKTLPMQPSDASLANEETRLTYRYLDLRREPMQANIKLRHEVALAIRNYLAGIGFYEIETPFMTRSTPEGARDYLVPSRVQPGTFYALPQSPQLFKQILMISGFDKYFQIVRCFRDEDLRADRQPEFTQIDLEMSFPRAEDVWAVVEGFLTAAFKTAGQVLTPPFPRMAYDEAMRLYGIDKPDMRLPAMTDIRGCFEADDLAQLNLSAKLPLVAVRIPKVGELSRKERDDIKPMFVAKAGARLLEDFKRIESKFGDAAQKIKAKLTESAGYMDDDLIVLVGGAAAPGTAGAGDIPKEPIATPESEKAVRLSHQEVGILTSAGLIRLALAQKYAERHGAFVRTGDPAIDYRFLWVTDFPMFEWDESGNAGEQQWMAAHHPFTSPHDEDMGKLAGGVAAVKDPHSELALVRALAYDVVLNGTELGSGSIRIHRQDVQSQIFRALGMSDEEARERFGFFLEALEYGTPPHGGIALGLDRIVMILAGAESLREVIPFPKTARAVDLMVDAPTPVSEKQLKELGIAVRGVK